MRGNVVDLAVGIVIAPADGVRGDRSGRVPEPRVLWR
ncbi:hypothetical protein ACWDZZ_08460 [Streptomyces sp. NPDC002990]